MSFTGYSYDDSLTPAVSDRHYGNVVNHNQVGFQYAEASGLDAQLSTDTYVSDSAAVSASQRQYQALQSHDDLYLEYQGSYQNQDQAPFFGTNSTFSNDYHSLDNCKQSAYQDQEQFAAEQYSQATMQYNGYECDSHETGASQTPAGRIYRGEPYAKLIHKALLSAPGNRMVLRDIYQWFELHTDKTSKGGKGWQNSIRHNLSMNAAFVKEEVRSDNEEGKRSNIWKLASDVHDPNDLLSTTRFRKPVTKKTPVFMQGFRVAKSHGMPMTRYNYEQTIPAYNQTYRSELVNTNDTGLPIKRERSSLDLNSQQASQLPWAFDYRSQAATYLPHLYTPSATDYGYQADMSAYSSRQSTGPTEDYAQQVTNQIAPNYYASPVPSMTRTNSSFGVIEPVEPEPMAATDPFLFTPSIADLDRQARRTSLAEFYASLEKEGDAVTTSKTM